MSIQGSWRAMHASGASRFDHVRRKALPSLAGQSAMIVLSRDFSPARKSTLVLPVVERAHQVCIDIPRKCYWPFANVRHTYNEGRGSPLNRQAAADCHDLSRRFAASSSI